VSPTEAQEKLYATLKRNGSAKAMPPETQMRTELYHTIDLAGYEALDASIVATVVPESA
jgi:methylisocitrate lyase